MALKGNTNEKKIWNYLKDKELNEYAIAGLMGNMYAESGLLFNRVETLCLKRLSENGKNFTDDTYTNAIDNGTISKAEFLNPLPGKQYGYGLVQWTFPARKAVLYDLSKSRGVSIADPEVQLDCLWLELNSSYLPVLNSLKFVTSVREASDIVLDQFECPEDVSESVRVTRAEYGQKYYNKFVGFEDVNSSDDLQNKNEQNNTTVQEETVMPGMTENEIRQKVVNTATRYLGYNEADGSHRKIVDIYNSNQPLPRGYKVTYTDAWCATFVSAVSILCGFTDIMPAECGCGAMVEDYQNMGRWAENDAYVPKAGDIIMYYWNDNGIGDCIGYPDHVGIVVSVTGSTIKVIEGNKSDAVGYRNLNIDGMYIRGYCIPDYASKASSSSASSANPQPSQPSSGNNSGSGLNGTVKWDGYVTTQSLSVHTWAGSQYDTCSFSPIGENEVVGVCDSVEADDGAIWYYIKYDDKFGFVHSAYVKKKFENTNNNSQAIDYADYYSNAIAGTYTTTADLNLRTGAGLDKTIQCAIPYGDAVDCYGYYSISEGMLWYFVAYQTYTGFVSSQYLTR